MTVAVPGSSGFSVSIKSLKSSYEVPSTRSFSLVTLFLGFGHCVEKYQVKGLAGKERKGKVLRHLSLPLSLMHTMKLSVGLAISVGSCFYSATVSSSSSHQSFAGSSYSSLCYAINLLPEKVCLL